MEALLQFSCAQPVALEKPARQPKADFGESPAKGGFVPHCVSSCAMQRRAGLPKSAMVINLRRGLAFELHIDLNFLHGFEDYIEYKEPCGARR